MPSTSAETARPTPAASRETTPPIELRRRNAVCRELVLGPLVLAFVDTVLVLVRTPEAALARPHYFDPARGWMLSARTERHLQRLTGNAPITVVPDLDAAVRAALQDWVLGASGDPGLRLPGIARVQAIARQEGVVILDYEDATTIAARLPTVVARPTTPAERAAVLADMRRRVEGGAGEGVTDDGEPVGDAVVRASAAAVGLPLFPLF